MQGKEKNNQKIDRQFMDRAWQNMSAILDQEMPVEKNDKKRMFFFPIAAMIVLSFTAGIAVMWSLEKWHNQVEVALVEKDIEVAPEKRAIDLTNATNGGTDSKDTKNYTASTRLIASDRPVISEEILTPTTSFTTPTNHQNKTIGKTTMAAVEILISTSPKIVMSETTLNYPNLKSTSTKSAILNNQPILATPVEMTANQSIEYQEEIIATDNFAKIKSQAIASLPLLPIPTIDHQNDLHFASQLIILPVQSSKWRWGINAGLVAVDQPINGFTGGAEVAYQFGEKWSLGSGVNYIALKNDVRTATLRNLANDLADVPEAFNGSVAQGPDQSFNLRNEEQILAASWQHTLNAPLTLAYQPTGKLQLLLGLNFALRIDPSLFANNEYADEIALPTSGGTAIIADQSLLTPTNRSLITSGMLGVGYHLTPRTALSLKYFNRLDNSFSSLSELVNKGDQPRFVQLTLSHYFRS